MLVDKTNFGITLTFIGLRKHLVIKKVARGSVFVFCFLITTYNRTKTLCGPCIAAVAVFIYIYLELYTKALHHTLDNSVSSLQCNQIILSYLGPRHNFYV